MMELQTTIQGTNVFDVIENPANYPDELLAATFDVIKIMSSQVRDASKKLEGHIMNRMKIDGAKKLEFVGHDGTPLVIKLRAGSQICEAKDADAQISAAGFDPLEFGRYVYEPKWSLAKEQAALGGPKKELVERLFSAKPDSLIIEENKKKDKANAE